MDLVLLSVNKKVLLGLQRQFSYKIEIQNGSDITDKIVLRTIERAMKSLFNLYLSARANGVIASGIAAWIIELENWLGGNPKSFAPK